jgi:uncharacterized membrane protein
MLLYTNVDNEIKSKSGHTDREIDGGAGPVAKSARVWQIDALRGVAMILMTIFHALVDIRDFFGFADVRYFEPPLVFIGRSSAILFMLISGVSCRFSKNNVRRGAKVFLCGLAVTAATFFAVRDLYIRFGILHFLGASMIIAGLSEKAIKKDSARQAIFYIAAPLSLLLGYFFSQIRTQYPFLFMFGLITPAFRSYDYYPLFPWGGVFFTGYAIGFFIAKKRERLAKMRKTRISTALCSLGKVSLIYYLLHQPALLAVFYVFGIFYRMA